MTISEYRDLTRVMSDLAFRAAATMVRMAARFDQDRDGTVDSDAMRQLAVRLRDTAQRVERGADLIADGRPLRLEDLDEPSPPPGYG